MTKIYVLLGLVVILVLVLISTSFFIKPKQITPSPSPKLSTFEQTPLPKAISLPDPTIAPLPAITPSPTVEFSVINAIPAEDTNTLHNPVQQIAVYFNSNLNPEDVVITSNPATEINVLKREGYDNMVIISPRDFWKQGITTFTVTTQTKSTTGQSLNTPFSYRINSGIQNPGL